MTDLPAVPALVERAQAAMGGSLPILINNAGTHHKANAIETTDEAFASIFATHVFAAFALAREVARPMLRVGHGNIIFVGSMAAVMGVPKVSAYSAAKGAVLALALAAEWSPRGVRVNAVTPGWIETDMTRRALENDPQRKARVLGRMPMVRLSTPRIWQMPWCTCARRQADLSPRPICSLTAGPAEDSEEQAARD